MKATIAFITIVVIGAIACLFYFSHKQALEAEYERNWHDATNPVPTFEQVAHANERAESNKFSHALMLHDVVGIPLDQAMRESGITNEQTIKIVANALTNTDSK